MSHITNITVCLVALLHFFFLYTQMVLWQTPKGLKLFKLDPSVAKPFKLLALQQGLYNGFLGMGLIASLALQDPIYSKYGTSFFLFCIICAGILGGLTALKRILIIQALPAAIALLLVWFGRFLRVVFRFTRRFERFF